ncbi:HAD family hydrolase [Leisingera sp. ANG-Vp]|uniref:HAD family hydrolase n=1 Tax=Leisingera sp. ANG-Vp TaxID=1577896 RepID=UPI000AC39199|nr:HAD family hydrolase [Leisingera sp. ANG-Vp]
MTLKTTKKVRALPTPSSRPALVIFDCDGVLVDSEPIFLRVLHRFLLFAGASLSHADCCRQFIGKSKADVEIYLEEQGLAIPADWPDAFYDQAMIELGRDCKAVDGIREVLQALAQSGIPFCAASNGLRDKIEFTLSHTGLLPLFENRIFSAYEVGRSKPAPDVFLHAASLHGIAPERCTVIEDSPSGLEAAQAAGMPCFAYSDTDALPPGRLFGAQPFSAMWQLPALLGL